MCLEQVGEALCGLEPEAHGEPAGLAAGACSPSAHWSEHVGAHGPGVPPNESVNVSRELVPRHMNVGWGSEAPGLLEKGLRGHTALSGEGQARGAAP